MEITTALKLSPQQQNLLSMHSALNVLNVVIYELLMLTQAYGANPHAERVEHELHSAADSLRDPAASKALMDNIQDFITAARTELLQWKAELDSQQQDLRSFDQAIENLESIFSILAIRARELSMRFDNPDSREIFDIETLKHNYLNVLLAIEKNSKGRYRIVYNLAEHDGGAYLVNLSITSHDSTSITMPSVFQDIIRDLLANARKYTDPGGRIDAGLYDSGEELKFVIRDSGHGIPENEIEEVVSFGTRASNVHAPTRGGGFGLTKAYYFTKNFGGRMWIDSSPGNGTRIEIRLPASKP
ncbi:ATP-binding protein [Spirochaeta dissipatitropha]